MLFIQITSKIVWDKTVKLIQKPVKNIKKYPLRCTANCNEAGCPAGNQRRRQEGGPEGGDFLSETTVAALIGLLGSMAGSLGGVLVSARLTQYRLEQLERKVQAHNRLIERTYKLEERSEIQEEKLRVANHRIGDLEEALRA